MIDTHSHILPELDDGSPDLASSLRMARAAADSGVVKIFCTPHLDQYDESFIARAANVKKEFEAALRANGIALELLLGFEVSADVVATATADQVASMSIADTRLLLVEIPHLGWPVYLRETVFSLRSAGCLPILAHPERNDRVQDSPRLLEECLASGAVVQATIGSLSGAFGKATRYTLIHHLSQGYVSVLASDAHFFRGSSWSLASAYKALPHIAASDIDTLVKENPLRLLTGKLPQEVRCARPSGWRRLTGRF